MSQSLRPARPRSGVGASGRVAGGAFAALALGLRIARYGSFLAGVVVVGSLVVFFVVVLAALAWKFRRRVARARSRHPDALAVTLASIRVEAPRGTKRRSRVTLMPLTAALFTDRLLLEPTSRSGLEAPLEVPFDTVRAASWGTDYAGARRIATLQLSRPYGAGHDVVVRLDPFAGPRETRAFAAAARDQLSRWLPPGQSLPAVPEVVTKGRSATLKAGFGIAVMVLGVSAGYTGGYGAVANARSRAAASRASRQIGVPGYYTYGGPEHLPMQVGAPWGVPCKPIVLEPDPSLPDAEYQVLAEVGREARAQGIDLAVAGRDWLYDRSSLYPPVGQGPQPAGVRVYADRGARTSSAPHVSERYDAVPAADGKHEIVTGIDAHVHLEAVEGDPVAMRKAALDLIGLTQGIGFSTSDASAFGPDFDRVPSAFTPQDVHAMLVMSGCAGLVPSS